MFTAVIAAVRLRSTIHLTYTKDPSERTHILKFSSSDQKYFVSGDLGVAGRLT